MIALLIFASQVATAPVALIEQPAPRATHIRVEIVAETGQLSDREWTAAQALQSAITMGTTSFTRYQLLSYVTAAGDPIRVQLQADHLRIGFSVPANDLRLATELADQLIRGALFPADETQAEIDELPFHHGSAWREALLPLGTVTDKLNRADVLAIYQKLFRPGNVTIAIGGAFGKGDGISAFSQRFDTWKVERRNERRQRIMPPPFLTRHSGSVATVALEGPEFSPRAAVSVGTESVSVKFEEALLAAYMLGQGKGSTVFRVLREKNNWSYRQEAPLVPTATGLRPLILFASDSGEGLPDIGEAAKKQLVEAVSAWTADDRTRALNFARSNAAYDLGISPLYFAGERPLGESLDDQTFLNAYWHMKTGHLWNTAEMQHDMETVSLERVRAVASDWISKAVVRVIPGR